MALIQSVLTTLIITFMAFGITTSIQETGNPGEILKNITSDPKAGAANALCYGLAYNTVTSAYQNDWLPEKIQPKGDYLFMVEEVPYPDATDFFFLGLILLLTIAVIKQTIYKSSLNVFLQFLLAIGIIIGVLLIAWILWKVIAYNLMYQCGEAIGIGAEAIDAGRQATINTTHDTGVVIPSLLLTLLAGIAIFKVMLGGNKKQ